MEHNEMSSRNLELANALAAARDENESLRAALREAEYALKLFVGENRTHTEMERIVASTTALVVVQAALRSVR
jgi:hypothetical protein